MKKERLGIYGGTFSPIHNGHVKAALAFLDTLCLDKLLVIPADIPPHKPQVAGATTADRLKMTHLAFEDTDAYKSGRLEVCDYEIQRGGKSYTVYTLEHFTAPERELYLLVGTDAFLKLDEWFCAQRIMELANIVLMRREKDDGNTGILLSRADEYREKFSARVYTLGDEPIVVSSSEIRAYIYDGKPCPTEVSPKVREYIKNNGLYKEI